MPFIEQLGMQAAGQVLDAGLGLALEGHNDRRQLKQQDKLSAQQVKWQKEMADYNQKLQLGMWNATNYGAQMEHLKKAGLNPALMYGKGGGGGVTTGSGSSTSVTGGAAPSGGGEVMGMMRQGDLMMQAAQIENIKADTKVKEAEVPNKEANTQSTLAGIDKIIAETDNVKARTDLERVNTKLKELELYVGEETAKDNIDRIGWMTDRTLQELESVTRQNYIGKATQNSIIDTIRAGAVGAVLNNYLTKAKTTNTQADTALKDTQQEGIRSNISLNQQQISTMIQRLELDWDRLGQTNKELRIKEELKNFNTDLNNDIVRELAGGLTEIFSKFPKNKTTTRETFNDNEGNRYETTNERY